MQTCFHPAEKAQVDTLLARRADSVTLLVGPGGTGKTWLARTVFEAPRTHGQSVLWFDSSPAHTAIELNRLKDELARAIAHQAKSRDGSAMSGENPAAHDSSTALPRAGRLFLLVIDGAEPGSLELLVEVARASAMHTIVTLRGEGVRKMTPASSSIASEDGERPTRRKVEDVGEDISVIPLDRLGFNAFSQFEPRDADPIRLIERYLETGGLPCAMDHALSPSDVFAELNARFREPALYHDIMFALAHGAFRVSQVARSIGVARTTLPPYLDRLVACGSITRRIPFDATSAELSRMGRYTISHPEVARCYGGSDLHPYLVSLARSWLLAGSPDTGGNDDDSIAGTVPVLSSCGSWWGTRPQNNEHVGLDLVGHDRERTRYIFADVFWRNPHEAQAHGPDEEIAALKRVSRDAGIFLRAHPEAQRTLMHIDYLLFCDRPLSEEGAAYAARMHIMRVVTAAELVEGLASA